VLLADDDLALVETLTEGLADAGYDAHGTGSSTALRGRGAGGEGFAT
jgi:hypothetical protein